MPDFLVDHISQASAEYQRSLAMTVKDLEDACQGFHREMPTSWRQGFQEDPGGHDQEKKSASTLQTLKSTVLKERLTSTRQAWGLVAREMLLLHGYVAYILHEV